MIKAIQNNRSLIAAKIARDLRLNHRKISTCAIQIFFNSVGLMARRKTKQVKMTNEHAKARFKFCKEV
jgi:hypothetical protein